MNKIVLSFLLVFFSLSVYYQFVDEATLVDIQPALTSVPDSWVLDFSDEFNGTEVNTTKWNIDNSTSSRAARPKIGISDWRWKPENVSVENGNRMKEGANNDFKNRVKINTQNLNPGVYLLRFNSEASSESLLMIKNSKQ